MVINNIYVTNTTKMTLSDRFTILQSVRPVSIVPRRRYTSGMHSDREVDMRNKRLIERLALRPIAEAASALQKRPIKQRIGVLNRAGMLRRDISVNRMSAQTKKGNYFNHANNFNNMRKMQLLRRPKFPPRANSFRNTNQSENSNAFSVRGNRGNRSFRRGRGFRGKSQGRTVNNENVQTANTNQNGNSNYVRGRGGRRRGVYRNQVSDQNKNDIQQVNNNYVNGRGRGRNQRRGMNRGWLSQKTPPTKEELDKQLDLYMAGTRSQLDKELDVYMSNAMEVEEPMWN